MSDEVYLGEWEGIKLKPCPFCGCKAELSIYHGWASIHCKNGRCVLSPMVKGAPTPKSAVAAWNARGKDEYMEYQDRFTLTPKGWEYPFDEE